jgi:iron complex outermembrane recepter protein
MTARETSKKALYASTALTVLLSLQINTTIAQEADNEIAVDNRNTTDVVVVTARKREELLQETPLSITAFSAEGLERANIKSIVDIADFSPGFSFASAFGRQGDRPVFRGMSSIQGGANASVFVDGVYVSGSSQSILLDNLERVEVINGPQSALYGRATFGGAINYVTRRPTNELSGRFTGTAAEHENYELSGFLSGPLVEDKVFFEIGGKYYDFGGDYENTFPGLEGGKIGAEQTTTVSGALLFYPTENFEIIGRVNYSEDDDGAYSIGLQDASANNCFLDVARQYYCGDVSIPADAPRQETDYYSEGSGVSQETIRTSLTMNYDFDNGHTLTSITAYSDENGRVIQDQTYAGEDNRGFFRMGFISDDMSMRDDFSQEVRLTSPCENPFRYIVGGYYYKENVEVNSRGSGDAPDADHVFNGSSKVSNYAVFGQAEYDINDQLSISAEMRYAEDKLEAITSGMENFKATYKSWTPKITIDYQINDDFMIFGVIAKGNKPGDFNTNSALPSGLQLVDEENIWSYEAGFKSSLFDDRVVLNMSAYYLDWTNQQLTQNFIPEGGGSPFSYLDNVGKTETWGMEVDTRIQLTDALSVQAIYAYTHPEIQNFDLSADSRQEALNFGFADGIVKGTFTPQSPQHTLTLSSEFRTPIANMDLEFFARGDFIYSSTRYAQVYNFAGTGGRSIANFRVGVENEQYSIALWAKNAFDNETPTSILRYVDVPSFFSRRAFAVSLPRKQQFGLTGTFKF